MQRRPGTHVRQRARQLHWDYVHDRWWRLGVFCVILVLATLVMAHLAPHRARPYLVGASLASIFWYLAIVVVIGSGSANWLQGLEGEQFTSDSLRRLRRRGWALVDDIPVKEIGNIDHALVGPGGAYAIESKHPREVWDREQLIAACGQAERAADRLHHLLATVDIGLRIEVKPILVVWGQAVEDAATLGVKVLGGHDVRAWRDSLPSGRIDPSQVARVKDGLQAIVEVREKEKRRREGDPPLIVEIGPFGILNRLTTGVAAGFGAWAAAGLFLRALGGHAFIPILLGLSAAGFAIRRLDQARIFAVGWLAGIGALWLLLGALYIADWLQ